MPYFFYLTFRRPDGEVKSSEGYAEDLEDAISEIESAGGEILDIDFDS